MWIQSKHILHHSVCLANRGNIVAYMFSNYTILIWYMFTEYHFITNHKDKRIILFVVLQTTLSRSSLFLLLCQRYPRLGILPSSDIQIGTLRFIAGWSNRPVFINERLRVIWFRLVTSLLLFALIKKYFVHQLFVWLF